VLDLFKSYYILLGEVQALHWNRCLVQTCVACCIFTVQNCVTVQRCNKNHNVTCKKTGLRKLFFDFKQICHLNNKSSWQRWRCNKSFRNSLFHSENVCTFSVNAWATKFQK